MSGSANIINAVKLMSKSSDNNDFYPIVGTVKSVDLVENTCIVVPNDDLLPDIYEVRLSVNDGTTPGMVLVPTIGSGVIVNTLLGGDAVISMFSSIDNMYLNGTDYGGLVMVKELTNKLNALENDLNKLKLVMIDIATAGSGSAGTPVTNGTLAAVVASYPVVPIVPTLTAELENKTISQGSGI